MRGKVASEGEKVKKEYTELYASKRIGALKVIPAKPLSHDEIMKRINKGEIENRKCYVDGGRISGAVYVADDKHWSFISDVMAKYVVTNALHVEEFASVS